VVDSQPRPRFRQHHAFFSADHSVAHAAYPALQSKTGVGVVVDVTASQGMVTTNHTKSPARLRMMQQLVMPLPARQP